MRNKANEHHRFVNALREFLGLDPLYGSPPEKYDRERLANSFATKLHTEAHHGGRIGDGNKQTLRVSDMN
jgi:hypothetical protein